MLLKQCTVITRPSVEDFVGSSEHDHQHSDEMVRPEAGAFVGRTEVKKPTFMSCPSPSGEINDEFGEAPLVPEEAVPGQRTNPWASASAQPSKAWSESGAAVAAGASAEAAAATEAAAVESSEARAKGEARTSSTDSESTAMSDALKPAPALQGLTAAGLVERVAKAVTGALSQDGYGKANSALNSPSSSSAGRSSPVSTFIDTGHVPVAAAPRLKARSRQPPAPDDTPPSAETAPGEQRASPPVGGAPYGSSTSASGPAQPDVPPPSPTAADVSEPPGSAVPQFMGTVKNRDVKFDSVNGVEFAAVASAPPAQSAFSRQLAAATAKAPDRFTDKLVEALKEGCLEAAGNGQKRFAWDAGLPSDRKLRDSVARRFASRLKDLGFLRVEWWSGKEWRGGEDGKFCILHDTMYDRYYMHLQVHWQGTAEAADLISGALCELEASQALPGRKPSVSNDSADSAQLEAVLQQLKQVVAMQQQLILHSARAQASAEERAERAEYRAMVAERICLEELTRLNEAKDIQRLNEAKDVQASPIRTTTRQSLLGEIDTPCLVAREPSVMMAEGMSSS
eukprot:gnl/TRDRNA2_/TRDRNA2_196608_c0_seq1.p1 gnl/TRDRNA2_/TRDRNA2_196608_c0~~gnl/TRDRNA2_/TRDRNA2_196608_c0_seq1.p1  ORF type:complete len:568 (-),score=106.58 gnl/TRDRNA2_/TRDRNA2_196608_c0_seq1:89-1792(-)